MAKNSAALPMSATVPSVPVGMAEAFEAYHQADHRDPAVAPEWQWWQAAWQAALAQQPAAVDGAVTAKMVREALHFCPSHLGSGPSKWRWVAAHINAAIVQHQEPKS